MMTKSVLRVRERFADREKCRRERDKNLISSARGMDERNFINQENIPYTFSELFWDPSGHGHIFPVE